MKQDQLPISRSVRGILFSCSLFFSIVSKGQQAAISSSPQPGKNTTVIQRLSIFESEGPASQYYLTLAADVPNDNKPGKVYYKKEPGHVFLILEIKDSVTGTTVAQTWGFYPARPVSCLFVRKVKCKLSDNGGRVYNAGVRLQLSKEQFGQLKVKAISLASKKYSLNRYNCYDYAVEVFNSIPRCEDLEFVRVKFPLVFGRGGSPCGLYSQLLKLYQRGDFPGQFEFGSYQAPKSYSHSLNNNY